MENEKLRLPIATVIKPHGIKGELNVMLADMAEPDIDFAPGACLFIEIEGLYVPFFVSSARSRGADSLLLTLDEVADEKEAAQLAGKTLYTLADPDETADGDDDEEMTADRLIGYEIFDATSNSPIGRIEDLTELTADCWYFIIEESGQLIPVVDEMIREIDHDARTILMELPVGLNEL